MPARATVRTIALACYALALAGSTALAGRVLLLGIDWSAFPFLLSWPWNLLLDLGWLLAFAVQHSVMARDGFKRRWLRWVPASLKRSVYAGLSGLLLSGLAV